MPERLRVIREPSLLLVEGEDDANFIQALFAVRGVTGVQVEYTRGKAGLRDDLIAWTLTDDFPTLDWLGIIQDGDDDPSARFVSICGNLRNRGLDVPEEPWRGTRGRPRILVGVVTEPDHGNDLEGLVLRAITDGGDAVIPCLYQFFSCVSDSGHVLPRQISKAHIRAWLATREPPTLALAWAAQRGFLPLHHAAFDQLANVLNL